MFFNKSPEGYRWITKFTAQNKKTKGKVMERTV